MNKGIGSVVLDLLSVVVVLATLAVAGFYALVGAGVYDLFPPPTRAPVAELPTHTPTPRVTSIPTWTPTPSPTETSPPAPTEPPSPTPTPPASSTLPPTPTFPPTATPTPRATRSARPFTYDVTFKPPQYGGCSWTGVAGRVQDLDGNPLPGYPVHVWGAGIDEVVTGGTDQRLNRIYGSEAAWEQFFAPNPKPMEVRVQLHDPYGADHLPVSEEIVIDFPGYCGGALGYVVFTKNH